MVFELGMGGTDIYLYNLISYRIFFGHSGTHKKYIEDRMWHVPHPFLYADSISA